MLDVYVCEDNLKQLELITDLIKKSILIEELDMQAALSARDPREVLKALDTAAHTGLFFLDIDLKSDMDGLTLAQRIRTIQPRCFIVFITSHSEMAFLTFQYKAEALDFIIKDTPEKMQAKIHDCLLNAAEKHLAQNDPARKNFIIHYGERCISVSYDDIYFFETSNQIHKIIFHGKNRVLEFHGQLKDIEPDLDDRFYRCHRSYIVNTDMIDHVDFTEMVIYFKNGKSCPIAVRMKRGLKKLLK